MRYLLFLFLFSSPMLYGLEKVSFTLNVQYDGISSFLEAGYSDSTTNVYDENYENDLPPFAPIEGIIPTYRIIREYDDIADELIYTDIDLRSEPVQNDTIIEYLLDVLGNREEGVDFVLTVPTGNLNKKIKEIRVVDKTTNGGLVDSNIINGVPFKIDNRFVERFDIKVRYVKTETSVTKSNQISDIYYSDGIIYDKQNKADRVVLYSLNGVIAKSIVGNYGTYDLSSLTKGVFFAYIYSNNIVVSKLKIVKL